MLYIFTVFIFIIFNFLQNVNGSPAVPTQWKPRNLNGQVFPGIDLLSIYKNVTPSANPTSGPNSSCYVNCTREPITGAVKSWFPIHVTATVTLETLVHIVNTKSNTTRDVTIINTEADLTNFTAPTDTNSLGTRTFLVTDVAPDGVGSTTFPVAFPSMYTKYDAQVRFRGVLPTTVSGAPTCLRARNQTSSSFPSHPTLAQTPFLPMSTPVLGFPNEDEKHYYDSQNSRFDLDPRGWTWNPDPGMELDVANVVESLFPDLNVWSCEREIGYPIAPAVFHKTALYVTHTTTMTEGDNGAPASVIQPVPAAIPAVNAAKAAIAAALNLPSQKNPQPVPAEGESALLSAILAAQKIPEPAPAVTPIPPAQSASSAEGLTRAGMAITAPPQANVLPNIGGASPIEVGGETITPNAQSQYVVSGQNLGVGSSITLGSGPSATIIGLQASGSQTELVVGSSTSILSPAAVPTPPLTVGGQVYQANDQGQYIIGGQTLTAGGAVDVNGTSISLAPDATQLVVGNTTENLESQLPTETDDGAGSQAGTALTGRANARTFSFVGMIAVPSLTVVLVLL